MLRSKRGLFLFLLFWNNDGGLDLEFCQNLGFESLLRQDDLTSGLARWDYCDQDALREEHERQGEQEAGGQNAQEEITDHFWRGEISRKKIMGWPLYFVDIIIPLGQKKPLLVNAAWCELEQDGFGSSRNINRNLYYAKVGRSGYSWLASYHARVMKAVSSDPAAVILLFIPILLNFVAGKKIYLVRWVTTITRRERDYNNRGDRASYIGLPPPNYSYRTAQQ